MCIPMSVKHPQIREIRDTGGYCLTAELASNNWNQTDQDLILVPAVLDRDGLHLNWVSAKPMPTGRGRSVIQHRSPSPSAVLAASSRWSTVTPSEHFRSTIVLAKTGDRVTPARERRSGRVAPLPAGASSGGRRPASTSKTVVPAQVSARAVVGGADERENAGIAHRVAGPDYGQLTRLQWLAQRLQQCRAELRRLVEEQTHRRGPATPSGALHAAAADQPLQRRAVVRHAERRPRDERHPLAKGAGHRVHAGHLQRLPGAERRQDAPHARADWLPALAICHGLS